MRFEDYIEYREGKLYCKKYYHSSVPVGSEIGHLDDKGYLRMTFNKGRYLVHRVIYFMHTGEWPEKVDHEDGNILNNLFENLRASNSTQNSRNRKSKTGSSSQYLGVSKFRNKWKAQISIENKNTHIGVFDKEEEAAKAYDEMAKKVAGAFARLNFK